jgi:hypothetical protein
MHAQELDKVNAFYDLQEKALLSHVNGLVPMLNSFAQAQVHVLMLCSYVALSWLFGFFCAARHARGRLSLECARPAHSVAERYTLGARAIKPPEPFVPAPHADLAELYRALEMLKEFRVLNFTAFTKILKKHDKHTAWRGSPALQLPLLA